MAGSGARALRPAPPLIWLVALTLGTVGVAGYLAWAMNGGLVRQGNWVGVDFRVYYLAAQALRQGANIYQADIAPPYVYPPLLAVLVLPLSALSITAATITWKVLQHVCLLVAGGLLLSLLPRAVRPLAAGLLLLAWLLVPLHDEIQVGESNSLVLALEVGAVWLIARQAAGRAGEGASIGAGVLLALAASIKVLPLLLIVYFWARGPRPVAAVATGSFLALQLFTFLITPATADYWLGQFPALFGQAFPFLDNQSLNAAIARALLPGDPGLPPLQLADAAVLRPALTWLANLAVLAGAVLVLATRERRTHLPPLSATERSSPPPWPSEGRRARGLGPTSSLLLEVGFVLLTIHLVSGSTWLHHLIDLAVPLCACLAVWWRRHTDPARPPQSGIPVTLILGLAAAFLLLLIRPADWVNWISDLLPGRTLLNWLAGNAALAVVLACWLLSVRLLLACAPTPARQSPHPG
jgi:hypothetical protein